MWRTFVQQMIKEEDERITYRGKLRKPEKCDNHKRSLKSDCCYCRKLFWIHQKEQCSPRISVGMVNVPKSEA